MSFERRISRAPRAFDAERGREAAAALGLPPGPFADLVSGVAGCSPYLGGLLDKHRDFAAGLAGSDPDRAFDALLAELPDAGTDPGPALRKAKARVALLAGLADCGGVWDLDAVTGALTRFADRAVSVALTREISRLLARGKLPGQTEDDLDTACGMVVLAMGKMGAFELNYSSDIDLICLFDETRFPGDDFPEARAGFIRATRAMSATLSDITGDGYVFRTDLRLRPDPSVTPVCLSMEAAERYYESLGRTWERAAYIKARPAAGDIAAGERFLEHLTPFVWRKHLDFAAIEEAHDMRLRIRAHKGLHGDALEGRNLKLAPGGIREIEFFTQTRQLIAGGRDPRLRVRRTEDGLARLAEQGWIGRDDAAVLTADYRAHREVEHRIQMIADQQTHALPANDEGFDRLAAFLGTDGAGLRGELLARIRRVSERTEDFFAPDTPAKPVEIPAEIAGMVARWRSYPAFRSDRALRIFERLKPELLRRIEAVPRPEEAMTHLDGFLRGLPAGVQLFSLFEANPSLIDLIVDIASTAPGLASYLGRNSQVFDAVIGGSFFAPWPGREALEADLSARLGRESDYENRLDTARRWQKEWHFRIGVHHLRGLIDGAEAGRQYSDLASAALAALEAAVVEQFSARHGAPPGAGAAILGMGSLGAERLTATSDLDLIVIYDPEEVEASQGPRPLPARTYYARLTQALITALTAPMSEGRLYETDMRLRPSGRQGPVATAIRAFEAYQRDEAWTWEHLALTRARPVAGSGPLGERVDAFRRALLSAPRDPAKTRADLRDMRARLAEAKPAQSAWEAKLGPGRLQDIALLAQSAALLSGSPERDTARQIEAGADALGLGAAEVATLTSADALMWSVQSATRLITAGELDLDAIGAGGRALLLRETGVEDMAALEDRLTRVAAEADRIITEALG